MVWSNWFHLQSYFPPLGHDCEKKSTSLENHILALICFQHQKYYSSHPDSHGVISQYSERFSFLYPSHILLAHVPTREVFAFPSTSLPQVQCMPHRVLIERGQKVNMSLTVWDMGNMFVFVFLYCVVGVCCLWWWCGPPGGLDVLKWGEGRSRNVPCSFHHTLESTSCPEQCSFHATVLILVNNRFRPMYARGHTHMFGSITSHP